MGDRKPDASLLVVPLMKTRAADITPWKHEKPALKR
jgi:hypothetical protein